jgi:hypothetical protein
MLYGTPLCIGITCVTLFSLIVTYIHWCVTRMPLVVTYVCTDVVHLRHTRDLVMMFHGTGTRVYEPLLRSHVLHSCHLYTLVCYTHVTCIHSCVSLMSIIHTHVLRLCDTGELVMIFRTEVGHVYLSRSSDLGRHWSQAHPLEDLPNPDSKVNPKSNFRI